MQLTAQHPIRKILADNRNTCEPMALWRRRGARARADCLPSTRGAIARDAIANRTTGPARRGTRARAPPTDDTSGPCRRFPSGPASAGSHGSPAPRAQLPQRHASSRAFDASRGAALRTRARIGRGESSACRAWLVAGYMPNTWKVQRKRGFATSSATVNVHRPASEHHQRRAALRARARAPTGGARWLWEPGSIFIVSASNATECVLSEPLADHYLPSGRCVAQRAQSRRGGRDARAADGTWLEGWPRPVPCNGFGGSFQRHRQVSMIVPRTKNIHACDLVLFVGLPGFLWGPKYRATGSVPRSLGFSWVA